MTDDTPFSARDEIMAKVRNRLFVRGDEPGRLGRVHSRLRKPAPNLIPERARKPKAELPKQFHTMLEQQGASVARIRTYKAIPEAVAEALRQAGLPCRIRIGTDPLFRCFEAETGLLEVLQGRAEAGDRACVSRAFAGAAETGTLFFASGPENPASLICLPELHIVLVEASDIFGSYEECWARLRETTGGVMPATVDLVSGPSRTVAFDQTPEPGGVGPLDLRVFIIGSHRE